MLSVCVLLESADEALGRAGPGVGWGIGTEYFKVDA